LVKQLGNRNANSLESMGNWKYTEQ
jgi:hypothetical protein